MPSLLAIGINHETATVDVREKVAFAPEQMNDALQGLCRAADVPEAVILSTCNRTEILTVGKPSHERRVLTWLSEYHGIHMSELEPCAYCFHHDEALVHMIKVASGLDSMILGEPQILGQMKSAYAVAQQAQTVSGMLNQAMQHTFSYAKRVRTETAIGKNPVSVAFAAVNLAQKIFADLSQTKALLIGAGETIDLVAKHLLEKGTGKIIVANRTLARAQELANHYGAEAILLPDIAERLSEVDIVISSTASQLPILGKGAVERAIKKRKHRPMFMFDIAVPRDIEPEVSQLSDVYLYTVDDLKDIIDENKKARLDEVAKADSILQEGRAHFLKLQRERQMVPVLKAFRSQAEAIKQYELERALKQLDQGGDAVVVLEQMARVLTNKLIHTPSINIKKAGDQGQPHLVAEYAKLFGLDDLPSEPQKKRPKDEADN